MFKNRVSCSLLMAVLSGCVPAVYADDVQAQQAMSLYNQHQYAASASRFETVIRSQPTARNCYYAALANRASGKELRARQLFQYIVSSYPKSQEAAYAKQALASVAAPAAAGSGAGNDLPESVKALIPKDMQAMLNTPMGREALQQVMKQQASQIDTIRKAEKAGVMQHDQVAAAAESAGLVTANARLEKDHPFTAADIARDGADGIDQTRYPNCWFEASLASLAELPRGQRLISSMIRTKQGKYLVRFPNDGVEYTINSTDLLKASVHDRALWASLIECAETRKFPDNEGADGKFGDQSRLEIGLGCITGRKAEIIVLADSTAAQVSSFISGAVKSQNPVVAATWPWIPKGMPELIVTQHAYTVIGFDDAKNMVVIRNPHGRNSEEFDLSTDPQHLQFEWLGDGKFKIGVALFQKYFHSVARSFI